MTDSCASLSAGLVGRRRPRRTNTLMVAKPVVRPFGTKVAVVKPAVDQAVGLIGPAQAPNVEKLAGRKMAVPRVAKTLRIDGPLNEALVLRAADDHTTQQCLMESALRNYLDKK